MSNKVGNNTTVKNIMYAHTVEILEADDSIPVKGQFHILNFFEGFKMVLAESISVLMIF